MKLIYSGTSPFVRKVSVMLLETGLDGRIEKETVAISPMKPGNVVPAANPLGKVPCLITDDGASIFDSRVITRYLDAQHSGTKLYPEDKTLWEILTLEAMADGMMDAAVLMSYERLLRTDAQKSAEWVEAQWLKISRALAHLEAHVAALEPLSMASIAVGATLGYLDLRHDDRGWRIIAPKLATWEAAFSKRPSMQATIPG
ncbi:MAG: glutathione S-transferase N-terminal domain-containing protein [Rhodobacteraceae bacterium]|nr:glutathione S-transferase N-terminal domain-containing protein [Paracoccaceae bacterium]